MRINRLLLPLVLLGWLHTMASEARAEKGGASTLRDWQTVSDLSGVTLAAFTHASPGRSWVIARIVPAGDGPGMKPRSDGPEPITLTRDVALGAESTVRPKEAAELLGTLVERADNGEQLHGIALGMLAARSGGGPTITRLILLGVTAPGEIDHLILADRIETTVWTFIRGRQAAVDGMRDPYLNDIFSRVGYGDWTRR